MADIFTKAKRSEVMSRIRGKGNRSTEGALAAFFRREGITGWRRGQPLFGKPDFVFRRERLAVFVDGCFWHGCPKHGRKPKSRKAFWTAKLERNAARDRLVTRTLRNAGWRVARMWEHELRPDLEGVLRGRFRRLGLGGKTWGSGKAKVERCKVGQSSEVPLRPADEGNLKKIVGWSLGSVFKRRVPTTLRTFGKSDPLACSHLPKAREGALPGSTGPSPGSLKRRFGDGVVTRA